VFLHGWHGSSHVYPIGQLKAVLFLCVTPPVLVGTSTNITTNSVFCLFMLMYVSQCTIPLCMARYPDLVVHRLLSAALEVQQKQQQLKQHAPDPATIAEQHQLFDTERTASVAEHCNDKRLVARNAQVVYDVDRAYVCALCVYVCVRICVHAYMCACMLARFDTCLCVHGLYAPYRLVGYLCA
jgi:hypothetical protein